MTITKKHLTEFANFIGELRANVEDKMGDEYVVDRVHDFLERFSAQHCENFNADLFNSHINYTEEKILVDRENKRIKQFEEAQKMLHNSPFGISLVNIEAKENV